MEKTTGVPESAPGAAPKKAPKRKRGLIIAGVAAAVIVIAGAGFLVWHEQPSFCNAICHSPMDSYVEGWEARDPHTLVGAHAVAGTTCLQCHESDLGQQINEGMAWVSGNFSDPMEKRSLATEDFCMRCHERDEIVAATTDVLGSSGANPHAAHQATECGDCHSAHGTSKVMCNSCHVFEVPEGWSQEA